MTLDDIKHFRQLGSKCPGHPEYRMVSGIETTTGPLGQGVATSVGMAIASKWMAAHFNRPGFEMFDFRVYSLAGDGCMMEGISNEAASLAGHLALSNLCWIYDNNHITIEGNTALAFSDDVGTRFLGYGWNVLRVSDANSVHFLEQALKTARETTDRPTLIIVDSHIAYGAPNKHDTSAAHGEPLGEEEVRGAKRNYGWPEDAKFLVPDDVRQHFADAMRKRGSEARKAWMAKFAEYEKAFPQLGRRNESDAAARIARGMGQRIAGFQGRSQRYRQPRFLGPGAQRDCAPHALADWRCRRFVAFDQDPAHVRRSR